jgi:hypothetical protein
MKPMSTFLGKFGGDERGQLSIEAAMMVPLIVWIYVATFTYFEAFRADATNVKAAYAVGDLLSRETDPVDAAYIDGMNGIFGYMTAARQPTWIRVSNVGWDTDANDFKLNWSHASDGHDPAILADIKDQIPMMAAGDTVIVVETFMPYSPEFNVGIQPFTFRNLVVTRPRFAPQLCWDSCTG